jgi:hypothetical protein
VQYSTLIEKPNEKNTEEFFPDNSSPVILHSGGMQRHKKFTRPRLLL